MKKLIAILLAMTLLCLTACTPSVEDNTPDENNTPVQDSYSITYNGTAIALNAPMAPIREALGEPKSYDESPSCAFEGMDKTYTYESMCIQTYSVDGTDYVYLVWFENDIHEDAKTGEGIRIGSSAADVQAAYDAQYYNGSNAYVISKGSGQLTIILENDVVNSIQYSVITG